MNLLNNLKKLQKEIGNKVQIIAVSKKQPISSIMTLYEAGQRDFAENYIQELIEKYKKLPKDIRWHMIGNIQSNKIKYIAPFIYMVHGIKKISHLKIFEKEVSKYSRTIYCLLQIKISEEFSKSGMTFKEAINFINIFDFSSISHIKLSGFMGIASFTKNKKKIYEEFNILKKNFEKINKNYVSFNILSMGMSSDYLLAIKSGSTMIRIGSKLFGNRK